MERGLGLACVYVLALRLNVVAFRWAEAFPPRTGLGDTRRDMGFLEIQGKL